MHGQIIETILCGFALLGIFGNLNVIVAVARKKALRTKGGMLVLNLSIIHIICNFSDLIDVFNKFVFRLKDRRQCFKYNILYFFCLMFQSAYYLIMALDLCFSVVFPIKHLLWKKKKYVFIMTFIPFCYAICAIIISLIFINDKVSPYCLSLLATDSRIYQGLTTTNLICTIITLAVIIYSIFCVLSSNKNLKGSRHSHSSKTGSLKSEKHKIFRSTFFMISVYIASWMTALTLFKILILMVPDKTKAVKYIPYIGIIVMPNFCQIFFVSYLRSPKFRAAYLEHFHVLTCGLLFPKIFENNEYHRKTTTTLTNSIKKHGDFSLRNTQMRTQIQKNLLIQVDEPKAAVLNSV